MLLQIPRYGRGAYRTDAVNVHSILRSAIAKAFLNRAIFVRRPMGVSGGGCERLVALQRFENHLTGDPVCRGHVFASAGALAAGNLTLGFRLDAPAEFRRLFIDALGIAALLDCFGELFALREAHFFDGLRLTASKERRGDDRG